MKALLVIDMQKGSFTEETPRYDANGVIERINKLAQQFRENELPVIYIQHDGSRHHVFKPNTIEWEILDELELKKTDLRINKYANDCFYRSELKAVLTKLEVEELVITGCATDFCVESTVQSALAKDYSVKVVADGHTTGERPHLSAEKVIAHYNWVWQEMIPTKGSVRVLSTQNILSEYAR